MVTVKSRVYSNHTLVFTKGKVAFKHGVAQISEELYEEIVKGNFPNIYKEGDEPEYRTKLEDKLRSEIKEGNEEFIAEINRLKNIIESQKITIGKKEEEIEQWKKAIEKLKEEKTIFVKEESKKVEEKSENVDDELLKELSSMKKDELIELAKSEDGGSFSDEDLKDKTKADIITMIISKIEK